MKYLGIVLIIISCGRESLQKKELLGLPIYTNESYLIEYYSLNGEKNFEGSVKIEGAGLHLKLAVTALNSGFIFLILDNNPRCSKDNPRRALWNLNSPFYDRIVFENGLDLSKQRFYISYNYYQLIKYLHTPKRDFLNLSPDEKLLLSERTLLFYFSSSSNSKDNQLLLMGCAEFHST